MYQMTTEIPFTCTGADGRLKLHEAAVLLMNCCQFQEYQEVDFCRFLRQNNLAVFLFSIQMDLIRLPQFREKVRTTVKIYGCKSIYGLRRLTMHDEKGELCLISNATGAFVDMNTGKAIKLDPDNIALKFDEAEPMECLPRKIPVPTDNGTPADPFRVTRSMLDPNGHLTSPVYISAAADVLPENFTYNRVRFEFKQQFKYNTLVCPVLFLTDEKTAVVDLRSDDGTSCAVAEFTTF